MDKPHYEARDEFAREPSNPSSIFRHLRRVAISALIVSAIVIVIYRNEAFLSGIAEDRAEIATRLALSQEELKVARASLRGEQAARLEAEARVAILEAALPKSETSVRLVKPPLVRGNAQCYRCDAVLLIGEIKEWEDASRLKPKLIACPKCGESIDPEVALGRRIDKGPSLDSQPE